MSIAPQVGQRVGGFGSAVLGSRFIDVAWGEAGSMPRQNANTIGAIWVEHRNSLAPARRLSGASSRG